MKKQPLPYQIEGMRLAEARKKLGLTQSELAKAANISFGSISAYERGVNLPKLQNLNQLQHVGINTDYVLHGVGTPLMSASKATILEQQSHYSAALQIEETPGGYDLGPPKVKPQNDSSSHELAEMRTEIEVLKMQAELAQKDADIARKETEIANERAEVAKAQAEAAKERARAEIAEARLEMCELQINDFHLLKSGLKRAERKLAETEQALARAQGEISGLKKTGEKSKMRP